MRNFKQIFDLTVYNPAGYGAASFEETSVMLESELGESANSSAIIWKTLSVAINLLGKPLNVQINPFPFYVIMVERESWARALIPSSTNVKTNTLSFN